MMYASNLPTSQSTSKKSTHKNTNVSVMRLNKNALKKTAWATGEIKEEKGRGRCNKALKHP